MILGIKDIKKLIICILLPLLIGFASYLLSGNIPLVYKSLDLPIIAPPSWLFAPVWTILFILIGIASYKVWMVGLDKSGVKSALTAYIIQLVLNFAWTPIFFRFNQYGLATLEILILLVLIIYTTYKFYKADKTAGYLMIPYILWVSFASFLTYLIWMANK